jgi:hypothetical protein
MIRVTISQIRYDICVTEYSNLFMNFLENHPAWGEVWHSTCASQSCMAGEVLWVAYEPKYKKNMWAWLAEVPPIKDLVEFLKWNEESVIK